MSRWVVVVVAPVLMALSTKLVLTTSPPTYLGHKDLTLQSTPVTCGPAALAYILRNHGVLVTETELAVLARTNETGTSMLGLKQAAERYGLHAEGISGDYAVLSGIPLPAVAVFKAHFVVITKVTSNQVEVGDPLVGFFSYNRREFMRAWQGQILVIER